MPQKTIIKFFLLLSMALLFVACPSNDGNVVDSTRYTSIDTGGTNTGSGTTPSYSYTVSQIVNHFVGQAPDCYYGTRLANLNIVNVDTISPTNIYVSGESNDGRLSKTVSAYYVGQSYSGDIMVICKTTDDQWNVTVSFCPYKTAVVEGATPIAFETGSLGATLTLTTTSHGTVYAKDTAIKVNNNTGGQDVIFKPTSFYSVDIN